MPPLDYNGLIVVCDYNMQHSQAVTIVVARTSNLYSVSVFVEVYCLVYLVSCVNILGLHIRMWGYHMRYAPPGVTYAPPYGPSLHMG